MSSFTGQKRRRKTSRSVQTAEVVSRTAITLGGLGTIAAVSTICLFLLWVVVPLFGGAELGEARAVGAPDLNAAPLALGSDEDLVVGWELASDGTLRALRLDDGSELERRRLFGDDVPTAMDISPQDGDLAAGFADGSVRFGTLGVDVRFLTSEEDLVGLESVRDAMAPGDVRPHGGGVVQLTPEGQLRQHTLAVELGDVVGGKSTSPLRLIDHAVAGENRVAAILREDGALTVSRVRSKTNLFTGVVTRTLRDTKLPYEPRGDGSEPAHLLISELGNIVYLAWDDGHLQRFEIDTSTGEPSLAETVDLTPEPGVRLTALDYVLGRTTLMAGDSSGRVRGWFPARSDDGGPLRMTAAHESQGPDSPVTTLGASARNRTVVVGHEDGSVRALYMPTGKTLVETRLPTPAPLRLVALAPRGDALLTRTEGQLLRWDLDARHPETSLSALFLPVWYEGEAAPGHVWESTGGTDDFEPKLGLVPLVFGTLKATFYSMIFSVPLALLAAIYTSEFLKRGMRTRVKQLIEMMATLPSVVLGFLAALWMAPLVEAHLASALAAFVTVPLAWLVGAYLWQLMPQERAIRWSGWPRLCAMAAAVPLGVLAGSSLGPRVEALLFAGDIQAWLAAEAGSSVGGWLMVLIPASALLVAFVWGRRLTPRLRAASAGWPRRKVALFDMGKFAAGLAATLFVAWLAAMLLDTTGLDPRRGLTIGGAELSPLGTYVQRNALIVGFVMGFAIVPIIYTLAEDALSAVPDHLRAASLATGATPWQTAVRVVVPTAMSGLFSAVMIGLGRAVGETMVVLMAAGNTPLMEANVFNGFRTLSANIAVELPEAVQGGSLYRVLFLAALTLFTMTFVINTFAEIVRLRFRKRAYEL